MSVNLILKSYFLKLISNHKTRALNLNESPRFLILMSQNIGDMIVTKISELISLHIKKDL
jgi:hypothetical protein